MIYENNDSYLKLITSEHKTKPKFRAYNKYFLDAISQGVSIPGEAQNAVSGAGNILNNINTLLNIETASGDQLDILGQLLALPRALPVNDPRIELPLNDESYRFCLKAKILRDKWDGTMEGIYEIMQKLFPSNPWDLIDNQDMTITLNLIIAGLSDEEEALFEYGYIVPKPSGVLLNINIQDSGAFGWDQESAFVSGWDSGIWANS